MLSIYVLCAIAGAIFGFIFSRLILPKGMLQVDDTDDKTIFRFVVDDDPMKIKNKHHVLLKVKNVKITQ